MVPPKFIYLGVKGSVMALNSATGQQLWATSLKGAEFVNIALDGDNLYAATRGEMFCLDSNTGAIRWHNPLKGYGWGLVSIAGKGISQSFSALEAEKLQQEQQAATSSSS